MDSKTSPQNRISLADPLIAKQVFPLALRVNRLCCEHVVAAADILYPIVILALSLHS